MFPINEKYIIINLTIYSMKHINYICSTTKSPNNTKFSIIFTVININSRKHNIRSILHFIKYKDVLWDTQVIVLGGR